MYTNVERAICYVQLEIDNDLFRPADLFIHWSVGHWECDCFAGEKATKKKVICMKMKPRRSEHIAIC